MLPALRGVVRLASAASLRPMVSLATNVNSVALHDALSGKQASGDTRSLLPHVRIIGASSDEHSYVICSGPGVMVNSVDYSNELASEIEEALSGRQPDYMLITHSHDTQDHRRWKERFPGIRRVLHRDDVRTASEWPFVDTRDVEVKLSPSDFKAAGDADALGRWTVAPGIHVLSTPGHTPGSLCILAEESATGGAPVLFSGDHLTARPEFGRLDGYAQFGKDIAAQAESMRKLAHEAFLVLAPGHGPVVHFGTVEECATEMLRASKQFADDPYRRRQQ